MNSWDRFLFERILECNTLLYFGVEHIPKDIKKS